MKLFHSRLVGLERHYGMVVDALEGIERNAQKIVNGGDYKNLPSHDCKFVSENEDATILTQSIFCMLSDAYSDYYEYAADYFAQAVRANHERTLGDIYVLCKYINGLVECSVSCEIDVLVRLWFYDIWQRTARSFDSVLEEDDGEYYDISNFKHLEYTAHAVLGMLRNYFNYLLE